MLLNMAKKVGENGFHIEIKEQPMDVWQMTIKGGSLTIKSFNHDMQNQQDLFDAVVIVFIAYLIQEKMEKI